MDKMIQGTSCSFFRLFLRVERYTLAVLFGFVFCGIMIAPTEAFDKSTLDTLSLGDQVTSDMLEEIKAFQAILNQPILLGVLARGGEGPPGKTGGRGTMGGKGPVGETGSDDFQGSFGRTGPPGSQGERGTPGYEGRRNYHANYANEDGDNAAVQQRNYDADQSVLEVTKVVCEDERLWIGCKPNEKINITNAFWGRDDFVTCSQRAPSNHTTRQYSLDYDFIHVVMKVKEICNMRPACEFFATRLFFGDVDSLQVYKYLRVVYECLPTVEFGVHRRSTDTAPLIQ